MLITQTPLRISFFGGGTDYPEHFEKYGGAVLGSAIDKSAYFAMSKFYSRMFDYSIRIAYRKVECVPKLDDIEHIPFRECMRYAGAFKDVEINHSAEMPAFTGLGSSSSFVVGLLNTVYAFQGKLVHGLDLAYQAIDLERRVLGESVGCQDQTFAAVGGFNLIEFRSIGNFSVNRIPMSYQRLQELESHLVGVFTGIKRKAEDLAKKQVAKATENSARLIAMRKIVDKGYEILASGKGLEKFGRLLHESWVEKRSLDTAISNPEIDSMYQKGLDAGAFGGKLLGAGGGGFLLFFVPPDQRQRLINAFPDKEQVDFRLDAPGSRVVHMGSR
jgi:D-glycero-alpha-D-manno-heptose-7-phosphate kinase